LTLTAALDTPRIIGNKRWRQPPSSAQKGRAVLDLSNPKDAHVDERLRTEPIVWLATTRPDGRPHSVPVWFWWNGATVLIFSQPDKPKVRNIRHSPHVVLALDSRDDGEDIVIIEGTAELLSQPATEAMPAAFAEKYAALFQRVGSDPAKMAADYSQPIRVTPAKFIAWYAP
jgi:PPOX class probable F420-dependent enzyme